MKALKKTSPMRYLTVFSLLLLAVDMTPGFAQAPGQHPPYLRAIRDLREAHSLLKGHFDDPSHAQAAIAAVREIDSAFGDLKTASHLDDKSLGDVPAPYNDVPQGTRFQKAQDLLRSAQHDTGGPESDPLALPARDRALKHINAALAAVQSAHI
jgi:hypothetical protein